MQPADPLSRLILGSTSRQRPFVSRFLVKKNESARNDALVDRSSYPLLLQVLSMTAEDASVGWL